MRKLVLGAICATSFLMSGFTGCGEQLAEDLKDDVTDQVTKSATACVEFAAAQESIPVKAKGCFAEDEIEGWGSFDATEEDIRECSAEYAGCSAAEKASIGESVSCLKTLSACQAGNEEAWLTELEDCYAPLETVYCGADTDDDSGQYDEEDVPAPTHGGGGSGAPDAGSDDP